MQHPSWVRHLASLLRMSCVARYLSCLAHDGFRIDALAGLLWEMFFYVGVAPASAKIGTSVVARVHRTCSFCLAVPVVIGCPPCYEDPNHKPEIAIALTDFEALCGFRMIPDILELVDAVPELASIVGPEATELLRAAVVSGDEDDTSAALKQAGTVPVLSIAAPRRQARRWARGMTAKAMSLW